MSDPIRSSPIRVLLVDDHTLFRSGIKALLQRYPEFDVVGEASDGVEGIKRVSALLPDVVLMDLNMPGLSGLEAVQLIAQDTPQVNVVMLTVSEDAEDLAEALRAGARGYLLKNIDADFLVQAIRRAANGEPVMAESMTAKLMQQFLNISAVPVVVQPEKDKLTPREREILLLLARGESNKEIARALGVAESTVKIHVQSILKKLNLTSRVQAAVYAVEHGLVHPDV